MRRFALLSIICACQIAHGQPTNPNVVAGDVSFSIDHQLLQIISDSDKAIIEWEDFSNAFHEVTEFVQPNCAASVLNRVTSANPSEIFGSLTSNGTVLLINPNGIIFGENAYVDTMRLVASTLDTTNGEFLAGEEMLFTGNSTAAVENNGTVMSCCKIVLLGRHLINRDTLTNMSGDLIMGAGSSILLETDYQGITINPDIGATPSGTGITSSGDILANQIVMKADGYLYDLAIHHSGSASAYKMTDFDGEILLIAENGEVCISDQGTLLTDGVSSDEKIEVLGETVTLQDYATIDTSNDYAAGKIFIGGSFQGSDPSVPNSTTTTIGPNVTIKSLCSMDGDGGNVVIWSDGVTTFDGHVDARGGMLGGNGALVEVSGLGDLIFNGTVDTTAQNGETGTLLLDPTNITISNGATAGGSFDGGSPLNTFSGSAAAATLNIAALNTALQTNNVLVTTTSGFGSAGNITFSATTNLVLSESHSFSCFADNDILFSAALTMTDSDVGTSTLNMQATRDIVQTNAITGTNLASISLTAGRNIDFNNTISAVGADVFLTASGDILSQGGGTNLLIAENATLAADGDIIFTNDAIFTGGGTGSTMTWTATTLATDLIHFNNTTTYNNWETINVTATAGEIEIDAALLFNNVETATFNAGTDILNTGGTNLLNDTLSDTTTINLNATNDFIVSTQLDVNNFRACHISAGNDFTLNDDFEPDNTATVTVTAGNDITITSASADVIANNGTTLSFTANNEFNCDEPFTVNNFDAVNITATNGDINITNASGNMALNSANATFSSGQDINIRAIIATTSGDIDMSATRDINVGPFTTVSRIGSSGGDITLTTGRDLNVTAGTGSTDPAQIGLSASVVNSNIELTVGRDLTLTGGGNSSSVALIGFGFNTAGTYTGDIIINSVGGDVTITGGPAGPGSTKFAQIGFSRATSGTSVYNGSIRGPTPTSPVPITGSLTLNGGGDSTSYALFGHGGTNSNAISTYSGDVRVRANEINLNGGTSADCWASIGYVAVAQTGGSNPIVITTPSTVDVESATTLNMTSSTNGVSSIGVRTLTNATHPSVITLDSVNVTTGGDLTMISGSGVETEALIGAFTDFGTASTALNVTVGGDLIMTAGTGAPARIVNGVGSSTLQDVTVNVSGDISPTFTGGFDAYIEAVSGDLSVVAGGAISLTADPTVPVETYIEQSGGSAGSLSVTGGNIFIFSGGNIRNVGTGTSSVNTTSGNLSILSGGFISSDGDLSGNVAGDLIVLDDAIVTVSSGAIDLTATRDISVTGAGSGAAFFSAATGGKLTSARSMSFTGVSAAAEGYIETASGEIELIAGVDIAVNSYGRVENLGTGAVTLVVDNFASSPPAIGAGAFELATLGEVTGGGGPVRIFTAVRDQNVILGTGNINGATFTPGPIFVDSATEIWNTYFPSTLGGVPFTIFYKDSAPVPPPAPVPVIIPTIFDVLARDPNATIPFSELFYILERPLYTPVVDWLYPLIVIDNLDEAILQNRHLPPYIHKLALIPLYQEN